MFVPCIISIYGRGHQWCYFCMSAVIQELIQLQTLLVYPVSVNPNLKKNCFIIIIIKNMAHTHTDAESHTHTLAREFFSFRFSHTGKKQFILRWIFSSKIFSNTPF